MGHPPQVPLTPQTDERNFPAWDGDAPPGQSGHGYPKMLTRFCTKEDRADWVRTHVKRDQVTKEEYFEEPPPRVGSPIPMVATQDLVNDGLCRLAGEPIIVNDKEHERLVRQALGLANEPEPTRRSVGIPVAGVGLAEQLAAENAELKRQLAAKPIVHKRKKRRVAKVAKRAVMSHAIEVEDSDEE